MATKRVIPLNKIEGVTAGGTAIIDLPTNVRYHGLVLKYDTSTVGGATEANMETEITEVRCNLEQVTQRKASASQIFDINRTKGVDPVVGNGTAPGFIPLFFSEPQRRSQVAQESTAWGMQGITDFQIEVDIANNSGQTPSLKGYALVDDVQEAPQGIVKWKRNTITVGATGELPYKLDTTTGDSYQGLFFFEQADGDIDDLLIEWDGVKVFDLDEYEADSLIKHFLRESATVSACTHVSLDHNFPADALRSVKTVNGQNQRVQELIAYLNMGAANNVTLLREMVGLPD